MAATTPRKKTSAPEPESQDFEYTTESGGTITLPPFKSAKPGVLRKVRKLDLADQFFTVLESLASEEALVVIDELEQDEFQVFQREWFEHSGIALGESTAS